MHRIPKSQKPSELIVQQTLVTAETSPAPQGEKFSDAIKSLPFLRDVSPAEEFVLQNGEHVKSLIDLQEKLFTMSPESFNHHVKEYKNDFATWIYHTLGDHELADTLGPLKTRAQNLKAIKERIRDLAEDKLTIKKKGKKKTAA